MGVFEGLFAGDPAAPTPGLEEIAPRFPPQIRRGLLSGALDVPKGKEDAYREAFPSMLKLLKALYDAGVTIIPGTDGLAGLHAAPRARALCAGRHSAGGSAAHGDADAGAGHGRRQDRGVIAAGKLADMILVDGDPSKNIADIRKVTTVLKGGRVYDPAAIEKTLGIEPRAAHGTGSG